jgi:hypothetical protein
MKDHQDLQRQVNEFAETVREAEATLRRWRMELGTAVVGAHRQIDDGATAATARAIAQIEAATADGLAKISHALTVLMDVVELAGQVMGAVDSTLATRAAQANGQPAGAGSRG